jgi:hypothetical protein
MYSTAGVTIIRNLYLSDALRAVDPDQAASDWIHIRNANLSIPSFSIMAVKKEKRWLKSADNG